MQVRVRVDGGSADESRSLRAWLRDEPGVRRYGQPAMPAGDDVPGQMGSGLEVLALVLGSGLSAAQLVLSVIMWRASHGRPIRVIIESDHHRVAIDTDDPDDAESIAAEVEAG